MTPGPTSLLVEGGASHTSVVVADERTVWTQESLPALNRIGASTEAQRSVLASIAEVAGRFDGVQGALLAVGAAATPAYLHEFATLVTDVLPQRARPPGRTYLTNDIVPLFFAVDDECDQLVIIAGTGSGVAARRGFQAIARAGAHEYLLGDDGGAFDIGRHALRAVIAHLEHRGPATSLTERVSARTGGVEIDRYVYGADNPKQAVGGFTRDVFAADAAGDEVASGILSQAAADIAEISRAALTAVGAPGPVAATFTGSLLTEPTGRLRDRVQQQLLSSDITSFRPVDVDVDLMRRTLTALQSDQAIFETIAGAVPALRI